jgi:hypothetical protein
MQKDKELILEGIAKRKGPAEYAGPLDLKRPSVTSHDRFFDNLNIGRAQTKNLKNRQLSLVHWKVQTGASIYRKKGRSRGRGEVC